MRGSVLRRRGSPLRPDQSSAGPQLFMLMKMCWGHYTQPGYPTLALGSLTEIQLRGNGHAIVRYPWVFCAHCVALRLLALWKAVTHAQSVILEMTAFPTPGWLLSHRDIKTSLRKPERGRRQGLGGVANPAPTLAPPSVLLWQDGAFLIFFFSWSYYF